MIYVDDYGVRADVDNKWTGRVVRGNWHHLISDQLDPGELHYFATRHLGLKREYFQTGEDITHDHYDVTDSKRKLALSRGATAIDAHELVAIIQRKREQLKKGTATMTTLEDADALFTEQEPIDFDSKTLEPTGRYDRYVLPTAPGSRQSKEYTRTTTIAKSMSNGYGLDMWRIDRVTWGVCQRDDLIARLRAVPMADKTTIREVIATAETVAQTDAPSNQGTAIHAVLQRVDQGEDESSIHPYFHPVVTNYRAALARAGLRPVPQLVERVCRNTIYDIAGKFDNIYQEANGDGALVMGDKKTKEDPFKDPISVAIQLAIYANSEWLMDYATGQYEVMPAVRKDYAIIVHVDRETFAVEILRVDIEHGWACTRVIMEQRELRKRKFTLHPYLPAGNWSPAPEQPMTLSVTTQGEPGRPGLSDIDKGMHSGSAAPTNGTGSPAAVAELAQTVLAESYARTGYVPEAAAAPAGPVVPSSGQTQTQEASRQAQPPTTTVGPTATTSQPPRPENYPVRAAGEPLVDPEVEALEIVEQYKNKSKAELQTYAKQYQITDLNHHKIFIARLIVEARNKRRALGMPGAIELGDTPNPAPAGPVARQPGEPPRTLAEAGLGPAPAQPPGQPVGVRKPDPGKDMTTAQVVADLHAAASMDAIAQIWTNWTNAYGRGSWTGEVLAAADARAAVLRQQQQSGNGGPTGSEDPPF